MRIKIVHRKKPWFAPAEVLNRREFHVISLGPWVVYWWGKDHWSENL